MSTLKTHNLQSSDAGSVNIAMTPNSGMVVTGISTFNNKVLIGTATEGHSNADDLTIATTGHTGITLRSATNRNGSVFFSDGTSGADEYRGWIQYTHTSDYLTFGSNGNERLRITSDGKFSLGNINSTPSAAVHIDYDTNNMLMLDNSTASTQKIFFAQNAGVHAQIYGTSADGRLTLESDPSANHSNSFMNFRVDNDEKLRIDSSGRVLIGTTIQGTSGADKLTLSTGGSTGITIRSGSSNDGNLYFAMGTTGNETYRGFIQYEHSNNAFRFGTNATERLRINADGQIQKRQDPVNRTSLKTYSGEGLWFDHYQLQVGSTYRRYADIAAVGDGAWGGILRFHTMPDGGSATERLRINENGYVTKLNQPRALVKIYSTTTISSGKVTNWASPIFNVGNLWNAANSRFIAPVAGLYMIGGNFRIGAPRKIRVVKFQIHAINTSGTTMGIYGGGVGGTQDYDGGSGGYDHPYVSFTNIIYLQANQYLELHLSEVGTQNTSYIQVNNEQSHLWCVLLQ